MDSITQQERQYEATHDFNGHRIAELRTAFEAVCDKADWRKPWKATVRRSDQEKIKAAATYFHADAAYVAADDGGPTVEMAGAGHRAWPDSSVSDEAET